MASYVNQSTDAPVTDADVAKKRKELEAAYADFRHPNPDKYHLDTKAGQARYALDCWFYDAQAQVIIDVTCSMMTHASDAEINQQITIRVNMLVKIFNQKAEAMGLYPYNESELTTVVPN